MSIIIKLGEQLGSKFGSEYQEKTAEIKAENEEKIAEAKENTSTQVEEAKDAMSNISSFSDAVEAAKQTGEAILAGAEEAFTNAAIHLSETPAIIAGSVAADAVINAVGEIGDADKEGAEGYLNEES